MNLSIIYEDESLIAINKLQGVSVIPGRSKSDDKPLVKSVEEYTSKKIFVVHRLDKETSGAILFAKDSLTHRHLNIQFEKREVKKTYLAAVMGVLTCGGVVNSPIFEFGSGRMGVDRRGKQSETQYTVENVFSNSTLLKVYPFTGRRHQIRVHLYSIGHPILGDTMYGNPRPVGGALRLMLHAEQICFTHPDGKTRVISASVDTVWDRIISLLK